MNLIEKVAKVLCLKCSGKSWEHVESFYGDHYYMEAAVAIDAMPSIKWQKIETLPEEYKNSKTLFLVWNKNLNQAIVTVHTIHSKYIGFYEKNTHWAEINAPEDE